MRKKQNLVRNHMNGLGTPTTTTFRDCPRPSLSELQNRTPDSTHANEAWLLTADWFCIFISLLKLRYALKPAGGLLQLHLSKGSAIFPVPSHSSPPACQVRLLRFLRFISVFFVFSWLKYALLCLYSIKMFIYEVWTPAKCEKCVCFKYTILFLGKMEVMHQNIRRSRSK